MTTPLSAATPCSRRHPALVETDGDGLRVDRRLQRDDAVHAPELRLRARGCAPSAGASRRGSAPAGWGRSHGGPRSRGRRGRCRRTDGGRQRRALASAHRQDAEAVAEDRRVCRSSSASSRAWHAAGVRDVYLTLNYRADVFEERLGDGKRLGVALHYVARDRRPWAPRACALAARPPTRPVLSSANGDLVTTIDFRSLLDFHWHHEGATHGHRCRAPPPIPYGVLRIRRAPSAATSTRSRAPATSSAPGCTCCSRRCCASCPATGRSG